jgi:hypothetical protein
MEIVWILTGFFIFVTLVFIAIAFFFPEWVGIQGKVAEEFERQQRGEVNPSAENTLKSVE